METILNIIPFVLAAFFVAAIVLVILSLRGGEQVHEDSPDE